MDISALLTTAKCRSTPVRVELIRLLSSAHRRYTVTELLGVLRRHKATLHKTTLYRELSLLSTLGWVEAGVNHDGEQVWEWSMGGEHHHHAVCTNCHTALSVSVSEGFVAEVEKSLKKQGFTLRQHVLEFLGMCKKCAKI
jgi:Fur family ferric uptake transcriptional regulator